MRIGIDASIWFYHAAYGKEGENPELRTLFFRCARLLGKPFLPLFVFDGPKRPKVKRGKRIGGKDHWLTSGMQRIIEAFGFEWRMVRSVEFILVELTESVYRLQAKQKPSLHTSTA
jgi:Holliday junction resolvase YEN1